MEGSDKRERLKDFYLKTRNCEKCGLAKSRTKFVFGSGSAEAKIMFVGEAPGKNEDLQGLPFVGQAGKLLDELLYSIGFDRNEVFIANVLKCRPPGNRDPRIEEITTCKDYLMEQIKIIDPRIIVTLGRFSMNKFLPGEYISQIHGQARFINLADKKRIIIPMYHPAAALRNGRIMKEIKEDFQKIEKFLFGEPEIEEVKEEEDKEKQLSLV